MIAALLASCRLGTPSYTSAASCTRFPLIRYTGNPYPSSWCRKTSPYVPDDSITASTDRPARRSPPRSARTRPFSVGFFQQTVRTTRPSPATIAATMSTFATSMANTTRPLPTSAASAATSTSLTAIFR